MFQNRIEGWFRNHSLECNDFIRVLLADDLDAMTEYCVAGRDKQVQEG